MVHSLLVSVLLREERAGTVSEMAPECQIVGLS